MKLNGSVRKAAFHTTMMNFHGLFKNPNEQRAMLNVLLLSFTHSVTSSWFAHFYLGGGIASLKEA